MNLIRRARHRPRWQEQLPIRDMRFQRFGIDFERAE